MKSRSPKANAGLCLLGGLTVLVACGPAGSYARLPDFDADGMGGDDGTGGMVAGVGGAHAGGTPGSGGLVGSGGFGAGGTTTAGGGMGGKGGTSSASGGAGGRAGAAGTLGGNGTGGQATGSGGTPAAGGKGGSPIASGGVVGSGGAVASGGVVGSGGSAATSGGAGGKGGAGVAGKGGGGATAMGGRGGSASGGAAGGPAQLIVSIDFVGGGSGGGAGSETVPMGATEIAGFKPASHWNSAPGAMGSLSTLTYSTGGAVTGASATWDAPLGTGNTGIWHIGYTDKVGDVRMMNGCLNPGWTGTTPPSTPVTIVTVSGLPAPVTAGFDVYVYVLGGIPGTETRSYDYAINTTTINVMQIGPTPTTVTSPYTYTLAPNGGMGNYIVFKNVTGSFFNLKVKPGTAATTLRAPVNGIQIVWPTGS